MADVLPSQFTKDPDAVRQFQMDWTLWLADGETIADAEIIVDDDSATPVTVDSSSHDDEIVAFTLSGGTTGTAAKVTCRVTTSDGQVDDRTVDIRVRER